MDVRTTFPQVTREKSSDLGFAWSCLLAGAVTFEEFKAWAEHVVTITPSEDLPAYMIDLMMAGHRRDVTTGLRDIVGFWPSDPLFEAKGPSDARGGLAALRGTHRPDDAGMGAKASLAALKRHPEVLTRFAEVFSFLPQPRVGP